MLTQWDRNNMADIYQTTFVNAFSWIKLYKILLIFVLTFPINNIPAWVQIMAWRLPGDKPISEPLMVSSPTHMSLCLNELIIRLNILRQRQKAIILQTAFSNAYSRTNVFEFRSQLHWNLFSMAKWTRSHHWFTNIEPEMSFSLNFYHWLHQKLLFWTTFDAASDENFVEMILPSQCITLAPIKWQSIIWTSYGIVYWCIYAYMQTTSTSLHLR